MESREFAEGWLEFSRSLPSLSLSLSSDKELNLFKNRGGIACGGLGIPPPPGVFAQVEGASSGVDGCGLGQSRRFPLINPLIKAMHQLLYLFLVRDLPHL